MHTGRIAASTALLAAVFTFDLAYAQSKSVPQFCQGGTGCAGSTCPTSITSAQATVPVDACPFEGENQAAVDIFAWNEFVAFNWPATSACMSDTKRSILGIKLGNQGPVVWQTQMASEDVFVAPGQTPAAWCNGKSLAALLAKKPVELMSASKSVLPPQNLDHLMAAISQPTDVEAVGGVVTDQAGRWLRYQRLMNQPEYNEIVGKKWYQLSVLNSLQSITLPTGSIEFKSAWKILNRNEISKGRYYTTQAIVYNTPEGARSPGPNPVTLGLVGLHIIHKTPTQGGFFWSTFEQVDNDAVFYNPNGSTTINTQTAKKPYTELNPNGTPVNAPVQIKRVNKIAADPGLNAYYQNLLTGSVFANYRLVSTQWQTGGAPQGTPPNVANIVIETYVQNASSKPKAASDFPAGYFPALKAGAPAFGPTPSTGCLACHINATTQSGKTTTDHSFLFLEAK